MPPKSKQVSKKQPIVENDESDEEVRNVKQKNSHSFDHVEENESVEEAHNSTRTWKSDDNNSDTDEHIKTVLPRVANSSQESSVLDYDADEIQQFDSQHLSSIDSMRLLKVLIERGRNSHNPTLWSGTRRLLQQLNFERIPNPLKPKREYPLREYPKKQYGKKKDANGKQ